MCICSEEVAKFTKCLEQAKRVLDAEGLAEELGDESSSSARSGSSYWKEWSRPRKGMGKWQRSQWRQGEATPGML